ncbi:hypothetical protein CK203_043984 [Vitis vinifera]|uniref:Uncharacterized protein n=1 Tax=Vitis vinifera TaxID=29760 RepID=A0A438HTG8_VITVI|nr:hypothetical protein CK203_043984 [Vitis vinifera]
MLDCKPVDTPMDPNVKLIPGQGEPLGDPRRYRQLVDKLNYLTITRLDISFPHTRPRCIVQEQRSYPGCGYTDADWAGSSTDRRSTFGYCVFIGDEAHLLTTKPLCILHPIQSSMKGTNTLKLTVTSLREDRIRMCGD